MMGVVASLDLQALEKQVEQGKARDKRERLHLTLVSRLELAF